MQSDSESSETAPEGNTRSIRLPSELIARYAVDRDPDSEKDIARYVEIEAKDETVLHVERVKREIILGDTFDIWEVETDQNRWWVISNFTNLYSQKYFPSLDITLSFHVGLMLRLKSLSHHIKEQDPTTYDEIFRRMEQAQDRHDRSVEAEDFQSVGMLLRECLLSLLAVLRKHVELKPASEKLKDSDFVGQSTQYADVLLPGSTNQELRQHCKHLAKETWQLVNWLTHARNADRTASSIAIHSSQTIAGHFLSILDRASSNQPNSCPICKSRDIRTHFDAAIEPEGDSYSSCGSCRWDNHPSRSKNV